MTCQCAYVWEARSGGFDVTGGPCTASAPAADLVKVVYVERADEDQYPQYTNPRRFEHTAWVTPQCANLLQEQDDEWVWRA